MRQQPFLTTAHHPKTHRGSWHHHAITTTNFSRSSLSSSSSSSFRKKHNTKMNTLVILMYMLIQVSASVSPSSSSSTSPSSSSAAATSPDEDTSLAPTECHLIAIPGIFFNESILSLVKGLYPEGIPHGHEAKNELRRFEVKSLFVY